MPFHINDSGDVKRCSAKIHCPFGDFETQHYTTVEEGRAAYEAALAGKKFESGFETAVAASRAKEKVLNKLRSKTKVKPKVFTVEKGHLVNGAALEALEPGDPWLGGGYVYRNIVTHDNSSPSGYSRSVSYGSQRPASKYGDLTRYDWESMPSKIVAATYTAHSDGRGNVPEGTWSNEADPELLGKAHRDALEATVEASSDVLLGSIERSFLRSGHTDIVGYYGGKFSDGEKILVQWSPRKILISMGREYRSRVSDAKKSGIAHPHLFALEVMKKAYPVDLTESGYSYHTRGMGQRLAVETLEKLLKQNDAEKLEKYERLLVVNSWDKGKRPRLDYSFEELGLKSEVVVK